MDSISPSYGIDNINLATQSQSQSQSSEPSLSATAIGVKVINRRRPRKRKNEPMIDESGTNVKKTPLRKSRRIANKRRKLNDDSVSINSADDEKSVSTSCTTSVECESTSDECNKENIMAMSTDVSSAASTVFCSVDTVKTDVSSSPLNAPIFQSVLFEKDSSTEDAPTNGFLTPKDCSTGDGSAETPFFTPMSIPASVHRAATLSDSDGELIKTPSPPPPMASTADIVTPVDTVATNVDKAKGYSTDLFQFKFDVRRSLQQRPIKSSLKKHATMSRINKLRNFPKTEMKPLKGVRFDSVRIHRFEQRAGLLSGGIPDAGTSLHLGKLLAVENTTIDEFEQWKDDRQSTRQSPFGVLSDKERRTRVRNFSPYDVSPARLRVETMHLNQVRQSRQQRAGCACQPPKQFKKTQIKNKLMSMGVNESEILKYKKAALLKRLEAMYETQYGDKNACCVDDSCLCHANGIECLIEGSYACGCCTARRQSCKNPSGNNLEDLSLGSSEIAMNTHSNTTATTESETESQQSSQSSVVVGDAGEVVCTPQITIDSHKRIDCQSSVGGASVGGAAVNTITPTPSSMGGLMVNSCDKSGIASALLSREASPCMSSDHESEKRVLHFDD